MKTTEIDVRITPRRVWLALLLLALAPLAARTADKLVASGRVPSPAAIYRTLVITGDPRTDAGGARGVQMLPGGPTVFMPAANTTGKLRLGPTTTALTDTTRVHVAGNLFVTGCIYLNGNPRCDWGE